MTNIKDMLLDVLAPVRDIYLARLLEEMSEAYGAGYDVETEVVARQSDGALLRAGPLALPMRRDLRMIDRDGRMESDVTGDLGVSFDRVRLCDETGCEVEITPFQWDTLELDIQLGPDASSWQPLRLWFLEWFQTRFNEDLPDFKGVVHALSGPDLIDGRWWAQIDLGSAPVDAFDKLITALGDCGARSVFCHASSKVHVPRSHG
ncbi:MAG: hypothetical protein AAGE18_03845 [Pseudomonadota bacterium]